MRSTLARLVIVSGLALFPAAATHAQMEWENPVKRTLREG
jgi:hypothetical protein